MYTTLPGFPCLPAEEFTVQEVPDTPCLTLEGSHPLCLHEEGTLQREATRNPSEWLLWVSLFKVTSSPFWLVILCWNKHCSEHDFPEHWIVTGKVPVYVKVQAQKWAVLSLVNPSFVTGVLGVTPVVMPMPLWPGLQCYAKMCLLLWIFRSYFFWKLESTSYGSPVCNPSTQEVGQKGYKFEAIQGWRTKLSLTEKNQFPQISRYLDFCLSVLV